MQPGPVTLTTAVSLREHGLFLLGAKVVVSHDIGNIQDTKQMFFI